MNNMVLPSTAPGASQSAETAYKAVRLFDRYYIVLAACVSALVIYLNYHATAMQKGIMPYYESYKRVILAGFDPSVGAQHAPTFPMWGYGWVLLVTENKLALLIIQSVLALFATWFIIRHIEQFHLMPAAAIRVLKLLVVCSLPWYAFHAVRWPYSINISLLLISFVLLHRAVVSERFAAIALVLSGVLFGVGLNLRSDYYLMPIGLAAAILCFRRPFRRSLAETAIWLVSIYVMLVPWMLYTWRATGQPLLTSTNSGHVLFIGLGNLPDNKWGITPKDEDPEMHRLIREHFGEPKSSLGLEADQFLKQEFIRRVREDPREYLRKCLYAAKSAFLCGAYCGEFELTSDDPDVPGGQFVHSRLLFSSPRQTFAELGPSRSARWLVRCGSMAFGMVIVALSYIFLPVVFIWSVIKRNLFWLLLTLMIMYQAMLLVFAYMMIAYSGNMYFFFLLNIVFGISLVWHGVMRLFRIETDGNPAVLIKH
jgi:hypothetical protein